MSAHPPPRLASLASRHLLALALLCLFAAAPRAQTVALPATFFATAPASGSGGLWYVPRGDARTPPAARAVRTLAERYAFVTALACDEEDGALWVAEFRPHPQWSPAFQTVLHRIEVQRYSLGAPRVVRERQVLDLFTIPTLQGLPIQGLEISGGRVRFVLGGALMSADRSGAGLRHETSLAVSAQRLARLGSRLFTIDEQGRVLCWDETRQQRTVFFQRSAPICDVRALEGGDLLATDAAGTTHRLDVGGRLLHAQPYPTGKLLRAAADPTAGAPLLAFQESAPQQLELRVFSGSFLGPEVPGAYARHVTAILPLLAGATAIGSGCSGALPGETAIQLRGSPRAGSAGFGVLAAAPSPGAFGALLLGGSTQLAFGTLPLPLALAPLGAPGCALHVDPLLVLPMQALPGDSHEISLPLPAGSAGAPLALQALIFASGANPAGLLTTSGLQSAVR